MNERARTRGAFEVHAAEEIPGQEITQGCTRVHAPEVHAPDPLFRGGGHPEDWEERLQAAVAEARRKREQRSAERRELNARRQAGLTARHNAKLARIRQEDSMPSLPLCCAEADEPPCPQHQQAARVVGHQGTRRRHAGANRVIGDPGKARPATDAEGRQ